MESLQDVAVERAVLASVFAHGSDAFTDAADIITPRTLTDPAHQTMWACAAHILGDDPKAKIDYPRLLSAARSLGMENAFSKDEDKNVLRAVFNLPVKLESTRPLAAKLRKFEFARDALNVVDSVRDSILRLTGDESIQSILAGIEGPVLDISTLLSATSDQAPKQVSSGLREYIEYLASNPVQVVGLPTGYRLFDKAIGGGLRRGSVNVIGARPKTGKSLLASNIAMRVTSGAGYDWPLFPAGEMVPVLQLDTEMTTDDQWPRMLACVSGVPIDEIETGRFASDSYKRGQVMRAIELLEKWPYDFKSIAGQPFEETEATMRRWVTKRVGLNDDGTAKPCCIIFDYLKLMDSSSMDSKNLAEFQVLGFMMTRLHNFAVRYKLPILTFIQLNRDGINVEDTSAASGSDRIVWLCTNFSIYKKQSEAEVAEQAGQKAVWNRKLITVAARHGAGLDDGDFIHMMSYGSLARIKEGPTRNQLAEGRVAEPGKGKGIILDDTSDQPELSFAAA